ncbi:MAG: hypothetical protein LBV16_02575 [Elusimicrobiota bacterium]|nr:hypothetical protein [Elusimicrobiota bacterium]
MKKAVFIMSFLFLFAVIGYGELVIRGSLANKAHKQINVSYGSQSKIINVNSDGSFEVKPSSAFEDFQENGTIILEFDDINLAKKRFNRGEKVSVNNPIKAALQIDNGRIIDKMDEYAAIDASTNTLGLYNAKGTDFYNIIIGISSFYKQDDKEKRKAAEINRVPKSAGKQKKLPAVESSQSASKKISKASSLDLKYYSFQAAMLAIAKSIAQDPNIPKNENIAVVGFQETMTKKRWFISSAIENDLTNFLINQIPQKVIVKNSIDMVLNELQISRGELFDTKNRKDFGKLAAAGLIVSGTYWLDDNDLAINIIVVDIQSGIAYASYRTRIEKIIIDKKYFENEDI